MPIVSDMDTSTTKDRHNGMWIAGDSCTSRIINFFFLISISFIKRNLVFNDICLCGLKYEPLQISTLIRLKFKISLSSAVSF